MVWFKVLSFLSTHIFFCTTCFNGLVDWRFLNVCCLNKSPTPTDFIYHNSWFIINTPVTCSLGQVHFNHLLYSLYMIPFNHVRIQILMKTCLGLRFSFCVFLFVCRSSLFAFRFLPFDLKIE